MDARQRISAFKQVTRKKAVEAGSQHIVTSGLRCLSHWRLCRHPSGQMYCRNLGFQNQHEIWRSSAKLKQSVRQAEVRMLFLHILCHSWALPHGPQGPTSAEEKNRRLLKPSERKGAAQAETVQEKYPD